MKPTRRRRSRLIARGSLRWLVSLFFHAGLLWALSLQMRPAGSGEGGCGGGDSGGVLESRLVEGEGGFQSNRIEPAPILYLANADDDGLPQSLTDDIAPWTELPVDDAPLVEQAAFQSPEPPMERGDRTDEWEAVSEPVAPAANGWAHEVPRDADVHGGPSAIEAAGAGEDGHGPRGPGKAAGDGNFLATFFGVEGEGRSFVYVIDCSESMTERGAWAALVSELLASLEELPAAASVQVIVYNDKPRVADLVGRKPGLVRNTTAQRRRIEQFVRGVFPAGGTDHDLALKLALDLKSDTIFFLTDGDDPRLTAPQLSAIGRLNQRGVPIHVVEFGPGTPQESENTLLRLARSTGGRYRHVSLPDAARGAAVPGTNSGGIR